MASTRGSAARFGIGAAVGVGSAAVGLGLGELAAGILRTEGPVIVIADAIVDLSPQPAKELAISLLGTYDKLALLIGIGLVLLAGAIALGTLALRRTGSALLGVLVLGIVGVFAAFVRRADEPSAVIPVLVATAAAGLGLAMLTRLARDAGLARRAGATPAGTESPRQKEPGAGVPPPSLEVTSTVGGRRPFLIGIAGSVAVAGAAGLLGRHLSGIGSAEESRSSAQLGKPDDPLPPLPKRADLRVPGLPPFLTPNAGFYRIDTVFNVPRITVADWRLRIHGLVDRPIELTYAELVRRPLIEADVTLACVSNEVGGSLVGNSRWLGVRLGDLLREAGVHADADQLLSTSADGWTCGTPVEATMDGRDAILAIGMHGEPLPFEHGFPVRMVVPGLYGYVSATKWVTDIEVTRFADKSAYWAERGWAVRAPIKTMSRIDVPGPGRTLQTGKRTVAGVAWAQRRGVEAVEVQLDDGAWRQAELAEVPGIDTWRQWRLDVELGAGSHDLRVRATDKTGYTQTSRAAPPIPSGATGWHTVSVTAQD